MSIQKVQATRSGVGAIGLLLAALAVVFGAMLWAQDSKAAVAPDSLSITSDPAAGVVNPGDTITYTAEVDVDAEEEDYYLDLYLPYGTTYVADSATCLFIPDADPLAPEDGTVDDADADSGIIYCDVELEADDGPGTIVFSLSATVGSGVTSLSAQVRLFDDGGFVDEAESAALGVALPVLRHVADSGEVVQDINGNPIQDVPNNVRGSRHTVCAVSDSDDPVGVLVPEIDLTNVNLSSGGGYTSVADPNPTFTDAEFFVGDGVNGVEGATCLTWISDNAGDQSMVWVVDYDDDGDTEAINFDSNGTLGLVNRAVVKQWNVLETSRLFIDGESQGDEQHVTLTRQLVLDPVWGEYVLLEGSIEIVDYFLGSHVTSAGVPWSGALAGVEYNVSIDGCGDLSGALSGTTELLADGTASGAVVTFEAIDCEPGDTAVITFTGVEGRLGSTENGVEVVETVTINFVEQIPQKKILLAWAGQRVVLEHNWALDPEAPADNDNCTADGLPVSYIRGAGSPGNFVTSFNVEVWSNDAASTWVDDFCTTAVIYESEQPGEVNVEAFISGSEFSKVAFVVYYMKLERVDLTIVDANNPLHNANGAEWVPGNPWDADDEGATASANVSEDVLVRGRVKGWFLSTNPSGRPADTSNPANVLPANRWVLPDDWAALAGPGAEEFRPHFDRMFGPNENLSLSSPSSEAGPNGVVNHWDAPMPPAPVTVNLTGTGFLKDVSKQNVYYVYVDGVKRYTNPNYFVEIPDHPLLPAVTVGGGFYWDGLYEYWEAARVRDYAFGDTARAGEAALLADIRDAYGPNTGRSLTVFSDNHGEIMVVANGDFRVDVSGCDLNQLSGGVLCEPGDHVGTANLVATADYPDFKGNHFPVASNAASIDWIWGGYKDVTVQPDPLGNDQFVYVVYHALDRDGFCGELPIGAHSLHPVIGQEVDFWIDAGEGIIVETNFNGTIDPTKRFADDVKTIHVDRDDAIFEFSPLASDDQAYECQAWVKVSNSLLGLTNVLVTSHGNQPEGNAAGDVIFDEVIDFEGERTIELNFRWSLVTWTGADDIPVSDALAGTGKNAKGNDISDDVTAIYGWNAAGQTWLGYFPEGVGVPGANDLTTLQEGQAYWIAIKAPGPVYWTITTNVD